jgi:hypothetical protein
MSASLRFAPMSLAVLDEPFDHPSFIFELKYDAFRACACKQRSLPPHFPQPPPIHDVPRTLRRHRSSFAWPVRPRWRDCLLGKGWLPAVLMI